MVTPMVEPVGQVAPQAPKCLSNQAASTAFLNIFYECLEISNKINCDGPKQLDGPYFDRA